MTYYYETRKPRGYVHPKIDHMGDVICARAGAILNEFGNEDREAKQSILMGSEYAYSTLTEIVRSVCEFQGLNVRNCSVQEMIDDSIRFRAGGMSGMDFQSLMENLAKKAMMVPLRPEEENWRKLVKISPLPDFKQTSRVNVGTASNLQEIANGGPIQRGYISDYNEYLQARTFGVELVIEYQTIRNDDIGTLIQMPIELRRKANKAVADKVFEVFTSNPTLNETGEQLFSVAHGNIVTSGAPPSVTTIEAAMADIGVRRGPSPTGDDVNDPGDHLNIHPEYLIVPYKLKATADQLVKSLYDPTAAPGAQAPNTVRDRFEVIANSRLDTFNEDGWFMSTNPMQYPTIEVGFLDGKEEPSVKQVDDWDTRGMKFAVWHDFDVKPMDYRGLIYNDGVT